jgi:hypothetical protein
MKKTKHEKTEPEKSRQETAKTRKKVQPGPDSDREAVLDERGKLQRLFPSGYSADIGVWSGDKVEVMLRLTYSQAVSLARLLKENKL